jgi:hypothetical protein
VNDQYSPWAGNQNGEFSDLDTFSNDYKAAPAFMPGLATLADGDYDFEVVEATLDHIKADRVMRMHLKVGGGRVVEHLYRLASQYGINQLGADLLALGFDSDKWGQPSRPLSVEIPKAVAKLKGVRFRGTKKRRTGSDGKEYYDLFFSGRVAGAAMPNYASPPAAPTQRVIAPAPVGPAADDDIPF